MSYRSAGLALAVLAQGWFSDAAAADPSVIRFGAPSRHISQRAATAPTSIKPAAAYQESEAAPAEPAAEEEATQADESAAEAPEPLAAPEQLPMEEVTERYANGKVKIKRHVTQDEKRNYVNHGPWTLYDQEGNAIATGHYKLGKRDGAWSRLQPQSSKHLEGPAYQGFARPFVWEARFADDVLHGTWTMIDAEGRPIRTWEFDQGRLHGKAVDWHPNGKKRRELRYSYGVPQDELSEWDEKGQLLRQMKYTDGRPHRVFIEKHSNGEKKLQGWYLGPKEIARVTFNWWEGTMRLDISEVEGKEERHGTWTSWHTDGSKQYEGEYQHDQPTGVHSWWYPSGQKLASGHFVHGKEGGRWTWWHPNGRKSLEGDFVDGKREGRWTAWHPNGQKRESGSYAANKKTGQWGSWDETGKFLQWRDHTAGTQEAAESAPVSTPSTDGAATEPASKGPLSRKPKQPVPELLQRWLERNSAAAGEVQRDGIQRTEAQRSDVQPSAVQPGAVQPSAVQNSPLQRSAVPRGQAMRPPLRSERYNQGRR